MQRIAAAALRHFFKVDKVLFSLGWSATLRPRLRFLPAKSGEKSRPEGFRSPRRNKLRYAQYNQRLNCCTLRYCSLIEKNLRIFFEEEKQRKLSELSF